MESVCYACLPLVFDNLREEGDHHSIVVVVVAPLSALMQDQVTSFNSRGLKASCVGVHLRNGKCVDISVSTNEDAVFRGDAQLVFMNPETLLSDSAWRDMFIVPALINV